MEGVAERLSRIDWAKLGVMLVVLHGSSLKSASPRDVDLVIFVGEGFSEDEEVRVMAEVERATGREADLYVVRDPGEVDCFLLLAALRQGSILYQTPQGREALVRAINICNDFMISRRKLGYTKTLAERVLKE